MSTLTPITADLPVPPPLPVEKHAVTAKGRKLQKLNVDAAVASHFTAEEKRAASTWLEKHPDLPPADSGLRVYPDSVTDRYNRELKRLTAKAHRAPSAAKVVARIEAAAVARHGPEKADHPIETFMADADERLEPYLAFCDGQNLARIVTTYGIANIRLFLDTVERWLDQLERDRPYFNRKYFLTKAKRAVEIRRRDAGVGTARAAAERAAMAKPAEAESKEKRGAEWATINHIDISRPRAARPVRKKDQPWVGTQSQIPLRPLDGQTD